jgi:hypothetical protein
MYCDNVQVELRQRRLIVRAAAAVRKLVVLDAAELVVLLPQIGLDDFKRGEKAQNADIAVRDAVVVESRGRQRVAQHGGPDNAGSRQSAAQHGAARQGFSKLPDSLQHDLALLMAWHSTRPAASGFKDG